MLLIGHRGCKYPGYNQNTLRAFAKVTGEGVPAIEFDVQRCGDGELVVVHNLDLKEVSTGEGEVSSTSSKALKELYAGDPDQGKDRIPFLSEVFDFFADQPRQKRPAIHLELKGERTGRAAGELFNRYNAAGKLADSDLLASSFNRKELQAFTEICPKPKIALLDGAIRREELLAKTKGEGEADFPKIFSYGNEDYMLPRANEYAANQPILKELSLSQPVVDTIAAEIKACLAGAYYNDALLDAAAAMGAASVNLWYRTVSRDFIQRAHRRGLAVLLYTVNDPDEILRLAALGADGIFTDFYAMAKKLLADS